MNRATQQLLGMRVAYSIRALSLLIPARTNLHRRRESDVEADRRPPVWRAVVRPARSFFASVLPHRHATDERHERIEIHGLGYVQIEPRVDRGFDVTLRGVAGH